jgi:putative hydroxymethylpyrimidine transport system permease protein
MTPSPDRPPPSDRLGFSRWLPPLVFAAALLGCWQVGTAVSGISELLLPAPSRVAQAIREERGLLVDNAWVTLQEILLGFCAALALGLLLGALLHHSRLLRSAMYPWLIVSQAVPTVAIAPIFVLWTGFDLRPKVMVIVLVSFFPLVVTTIEGLGRVDPDLVAVLRTLGATPFRIFRAAQLPAALPSIFAGMRVAAVFSVVGAVFGEWVGSSAGLGYLILTFNNQTATADVFATIALLALLGIGLFALVVMLERVLVPWHHSTGH